jgi:hypothetical protein
VDKIGPSWCLGVNNYSQGPYALRLCSVPGCSCQLPDIIKLQGTFSVHHWRVMGNSTQTIQCGAHPEESRQHMWRWVGLPLSSLASHCSAATPPKSPWKSIVTIGNFNSGTNKWPDLRTIYCISWWEEGAKPGSARDLRVLSCRVNSVGTDL